MGFVRLSIAELMIVVLVVAIDLAAFRFLSTKLEPWLNQQLDDLIVVGTFPMANILAAGLWYGFHRRSGTKNFPQSVVQFEVWGWAALIVWTGCFVLFTETIHSGADRFARSLFAPNSVPRELAFLATLVGLLLLPPLAVALMACRLRGRRRIRIVIEPHNVSSREQQTATLTNSRLSADESGRLDGN